jgi:hypothetical protein
MVGDGFGKERLQRRGELVEPVVDGVELVEGGVAHVGGWLVGGMYSRG